MAVLEPVIPNKTDEISAGQNDVQAHEQDDILSVLPTGMNTMDSVKSI